MLDAIKAAMWARMSEASAGLFLCFARGTELQARAAMARRVRIRARLTPVRYRGLRRRRASLLMQSVTAFEDAKRWGAIEMAAHNAAMGVG
jgi:hypothetical protein